MTMKVQIAHLGEFYPLDDRAHHSAIKTNHLLRNVGEFGFCRECEQGHITASGFIISPDRSKVLLMHHRKLGKWFQPGGHCDGDQDVRSVALRELHEETGILNISLLSSLIFDIDVHEIPARKGEASHLHYDVRFLFEADPDKPFPGNHESIDLAWVNLSDIESYTSSDSVLIVRHAAQWLEARATAASQV